MEKTIQLKISLDDKASFETEKGREDITSEVFDVMVEAMESAIKETLSFDNGDFTSSILQNYQQTLPDNFEGFDKIGFKIEIK